VTPYQNLTPSIDYRVIDAKFSFNYLNNNIVPNFHPDPIFLLSRASPTGTTTTTTYNDMESVPDPKKTLILHLFTFDFVSVIASPMCHVRRAEATADINYADELYYRPVLFSLWHTL